MPVLLLETKFTSPQPAVLNWPDATCNWDQTLNAMLLITTNFPSPHL